jgi:hypothetical protein
MIFQHQEKTLTAFIIALLKQLVVGTQLTLHQGKSFIA